MDRPPSDLPSSSDESVDSFTAEQIADVFELEPWQRSLLADIESGRRVSLEAVAAAQRRHFRGRFYEQTNAMYRALGYRVEEHERYAVIYPPTNDTEEPS